MAAVLKEFDALDYLRRLKELGVDDEVAELQTRQLEQLNEAILEQNREIKNLKFHELASKGDVRESELRLQKEIEVVRKEIKEVELSLQKEIETVRKEIKEVELKIEQVRTGVEKSKNQILVFSGLMYAGLFVVLGGMMAHGFHWF